MDDKLDQVWQSSLGPDLSHEEVGILASIMTQRALRDGEFLIEEGTSDELLVTREGTYELQFLVRDDLVPLRDLGSM